MWCTARALTLATRGLPLAAARSAASATHAQRLQPPCRAAASAADGGGGGSGSGSTRQIAPPDVQELARMAHIAVTDEEVADWGPKIESIVEWFGQLQEVDVEGVPPALQADVEQGALRPDEAVRHAGESRLVEQAADTDGPYVRVPKIATGADN